MTSIRRLALAVCTAAALVPATAHAQGAQTLRLNARLTSFHKLDVGRTGDSAGDAFTFTDKLSHGGSDLASCVHTGRVYYLCGWTVELAGGSLQLQGRARDTNAGYTLALVGGTGRFEGARGTMRVTDALRKVAHYRIHIL